MCRIHLSEPSIVARPRNDLWPDFFLTALIIYTLWALVNDSTQNFLFLIAEITFFYELLKKTDPWLSALLAVLNTIEDEMGLIEVPILKHEQILPLHTITRQTLFSSRLLD